MAASNQGSEVIFNNVSKMAFFKKTQTIILKNCSFTVEPGKLTVLIGPSGCGKTTVINLIAGYERPDIGRTICRSSFSIISGICQTSCRLSNSMHSSTPRDCRHSKPRRRLATVFSTR